MGTRARKSKYKHIQKLNENLLNEACINAGIPGDDGNNGDDQGVSSGCDVPLNCMQLSKPLLIIFLHSPTLGSCINS